MSPSRGAPIVVHIGKDLLSVTLAEHGAWSSNSATATDIVAANRIGVIAAAAIDEGAAVWHGPSGLPIELLEARDSRGRSLCSVCSSS